MLEQVNNAVAFYAFFTESKTGKTGLTVTVDVWRVNTSGTATEVVTAGAAVEIGDGLYRYGLSSGSVTVEGEYLAVFKTATTSVDAQHIPALWVVNKAGVENLDASVSSVVTGVSSANSTLSSIVTTLAAMAATVWSYATRTLTGSAQPVASSLAAGATVTTYRDSTWSVTLTGLPVLTGWTKLFVTLRTDPDGNDADSLVQIQLSSPGTGSDGLLYINGAVAATPANGSIAVLSSTSITITLAAVEAAKLTHQKTKYDVKKFTASSVDFVSTEGTWQIKASPTRAVA